MARKICLKYYFSVEGETEKWYLEWLQKKINEDTSAKFNVNFDIKITKNPGKRVKSLNIVNKTDILHVFDYEEIQNETAFKNTLSNMKKASKMKNIDYILGYCNYTFNLWIILHKKDELAGKNDRNQYLTVINTCYDEAFESMSKYKEKGNFEKILNKLTLEDVKTAIKNAEKISQKNIENYQKIEHAGYSYYRNNPSLNLHEYIKMIFRKVGLLE